jgi:hypothetical protein
MLQLTTLSHAMSPKYNVCRYLEMTPHWPGLTKILSGTSTGTIEFGSDQSRLRPTSNMLFGKPRKDPSNQSTILILVDFHVK